GPVGQAAGIFKAWKVLSGTFHQGQMLFRSMMSRGPFGLMPSDLAQLRKGNLFLSMPAVQRGLAAIREGSPLYNRLQQLGLGVGRNPDSLREAMTSKLGIPGNIANKLGHDQLWRSEEHTSELQSRGHL